jgi:hypothetical protein
MARRSFDFVLFLFDVARFAVARFAAILETRLTPALRFEELFLRVAMRFFDLAMIASFVASGTPPRSSTLANLQVIRHAAERKALS